MHRFKALIFDVDGTLADTERDGHRPAFNAAFADAGLDWFWDEPLYGELLAVTGGRERILYFMAHAGIRLGAGPDPDAFARELHRAKTRHYLQRLESGAIPLRPGVLRLLREARAAGIRLAIATTTTPENVDTLLDRAGVPGLRGWFETICAGESVPRKKPAPDIYDLALERLGLAARDCVAVEDSDNGARAALEAGLRALLITVNDYTLGQDFGAAPLVVDGLGEPDQPARALSGSLGARPWVDLDTLDLIHDSVHGGSV